MIATETLPAAAAVRSAIAARPDRVALRTRGDGVRITWRETRCAPVTPPNVNGWH